MINILIMLELRPQNSPNWTLCIGRPGLPAKHVLMGSKLPSAVLAKIWSLADVDRDNQLDQEEFCLAMYLVQQKVSARAELGTFGIF